MRLYLIRHAPGLDEGRLAGRRDIPADCSDRAGFDWLTAALPTGAAAIRSPALRCEQTAAALGLAADPVEALWEQNHGICEGMRLDKLPDLGPLSTAALAGHRNEGGENFFDMAARVIPVLRGLTAETVIVGHAGTVRAALSIITGPAALSFEVSPLSLTVLRRAGRDWAVEAVNLTRVRTAC